MSANFIASIRNTSYLPRHFLDIFYLRTTVESQPIKHVKHRWTQGCVLCSGPTPPISQEKALFLLHPDRFILYPPPGR